MRAKGTLEGVVKRQIGKNNTRALTGNDKEGLLKRVLGSIGASEQAKGRKRKVSARASSNGSSSVLRPWRPGTIETNCQTNASHAHSPSHTHAPPCTG